MGKHTAVTKEKTRRSVSITLLKPAFFCDAALCDLRLAVGFLLFSVISSSDIYGILSALLYTVVILLSGTELFVRAWSDITNRQLPSRALSVSLCVIMLLFCRAFSTATCIVLFTGLFCRMDLLISLPQENQICTNIGFSTKRNALFRRIFSAEDWICMAAVPIYILLSLKAKQWISFSYIVCCVVMLTDHHFCTEAMSLAEERMHQKLESENIHVQNRSVYHALANIDTFVTGLTGTLTSADMVVEEIFTREISQDFMVSAAAAAESISKHPIAKAIRNASFGREDLFSDAEIRKCSEAPGEGISVYVNEMLVNLGSYSFLEAHGFECVQPERPGIAIHMAIDHMYVGYFRLTDKIRGDSYVNLSRIRFEGVSCFVLLTGTSGEIAKKSAITLNMDMVKSELNNSEKLKALKYIQTHQQEGKYTLYYGTDFDEEELIKAADVGIFATENSDISYPDADVVIQDSISVLPELLHAAKQTLGLKRSFATLLLSIQFILFVSSLLQLIGLEFVICSCLVIRLLMCLGAYFWDRMIR